VVHRARGIALVHSTPKSIQSPGLEAKELASDKRYRQVIAKTQKPFWQRLFLAVSSCRLLCKRIRHHNTRRQLKGHLLEQIDLVHRLSTVRTKNFTGLLENSRTAFHDQFQQMLDPNHYKFKHILWVLLFKLSYPYKASLDGKKLIKTWSKTSNNPIKIEHFYGEELLLDLSSHSSFK